MCWFSNLLKNPHFPPWSWLDLLGDLAARVSGSHLRAVVGQSGPDDDFMPIADIREVIDFEPRNDVPPA
jgi:hypothetical protein